MPTKQELLKAHVATLMATGMAHEYNPETIATRAFIDGYEAAIAMARVEEFEKRRRDRTSRESK